jgi:hypothetical protein
MALQLDLTSISRRRSGILRISTMRRRTRAFADRKGVFHLLFQSESLPVMMMTVAWSAIYLARCS